MSRPPERGPLLRLDEVPTRLQERAIVATAAGWGGAELRPTRLFLWLGPRERGHVWLVPLGGSDGRPRLLRRARRRRHLTLGRRWEISYLGNPVLTLGLVGWRILTRSLRRSDNSSGACAPPLSPGRRDP